MFKQIAHCLDYYIFTKNFKSGIINLPTLVFQDWFVYSRFSVFPYEIYKNCTHNTVTFPKVTLYTHTLLNMLINSSRFLLFFPLDLPPIQSCHQQINIVLFFFTILLPLVFFKIIYCPK